MTDLLSPVKENGIRRTAAEQVVVPDRSPLRSSVNAGQAQAPRSAAIPGRPPGSQPANVTAPARINPADVKIDDEFRQLNAPLSPAELAGFQARLAREGCRDALVVWAGHNLLLDGHNRFLICTPLGIPFEVVGIELPDRAAALAWISGNQRDRRNQTRAGQSYTRGKHYLALKLKVGRPAGPKPDDGVVTVAEKMGHADTFSTASAARGHDLTTAPRMGLHYNVTDRTIKRDRHFAVAVDTIAAHCGDDARALIVSSDAPVFRSDVLQLLRLAPEEQRSIIELVREHGRAALRSSSCCGSHCWREQSSAMLNLGLGERRD
jgi:hypothetical protein